MGEVRIAGPGCTPAATLRAAGGARITRRRLFRGALGLVAAAGVPGVVRPLPVWASPSTGSSPRSPRYSAVAGADTAVVQWNHLALQAVRVTRPGPPMVARALAVMHTCIYDAWAMYDPVAAATAASGRLRQKRTAQTAANKHQAISFAAYSALSDLFPAQSQLFDGALVALGYNPADASTDPRTPAGIGTRCALAGLDARHDDGSNQLGDLNPGTYSDYTGYVPVNTPDEVVDPDRWQPLRVPDGQGGFTVQRYVGPQWGHVKPFALADGAELRPAEGPATYGSSRYRMQADQLLDYSANLTDQQKVIAEYWADGPASELPPGHWCLFGEYISRRDGHDLDSDVQMFFTLSNAVLDAGIAAWDAKRAYNSVRPVTAIRYLYRGQPVRAWGGPHQGTQTIDGADWLPYQASMVVTPAFPEFISGHSTFSAAGAEVLKRFTGSDAFGGSVTVPAGGSKFEAGQVPAEDVTLAWETFSDAADEAGLSRRYGGIHFEQGDLVGRQIGRLVGAKVWNRAQAHINGSV